MRSSGKPSLAGLDRAGVFPGFPRNFAHISSKLLLRVEFGGVPPTKRYVRTLTASTLERDLIWK